MLAAPKTCRMQPSPARDNQQLTNCTATYIVRQQLTKGPASHSALQQQQLGCDLRQLARPTTWTVEQCCQPLSNVEVYWYVPRRIVNRS